MRHHREAIHDITIAIGVLTPGTHHRENAEIALAEIIDWLEDKQENFMAREAKVIAALQAKNDAQAAEITALKAQIPTAGTVKDAADLAAEDAAATALGLDANGDPVTATTTTVAPPAAADAGGASADLHPAQAAQLIPTP